jgi:hypothetical protein
MNGLLYARKYIRLWQSSPVMGPFDEKLYPFVIDPLLALDNIYEKILTILGPTQSFKTVFLQIATAYLLDWKRKSLLAVSQTDDDADEFAKVKLMPFLERIPSLILTLKSGRGAKTLDLWTWATHELIISGPGANAQQSKSVCYLVTDESHQYCLTNPGAMTALRDRMGMRWDRKEIHGTTAPHAGTEVDLLYHDGPQHEWHQCCPKCHELVWPLWKEASKAHYNGAEVFQWTESQSESETLASIRFVCPHCDTPFEDTRHVREALDEGAKYVSKHPNPEKIQPDTNSYRWNAFAPRWKPYSGLLATYLKSIHSFKMGELEPFKNWVTKYEVRSWTGEYPIIGNSTRGRNYESKDIKVEVIEPEHERFASFDQQEAGGLHFWAQACEYHKSGNSKRLEYAKLYTYDDCEAFRKRWGVKDGNVSMDYGQGMREREIFGMCARFHWIALKSTDEEQFAHVYNRAGQQSETIYLPYSVQFLESVTVGTHNQKQIMLPARRWQKARPAWVLSRDALEQAENLSRILRVKGWFYAQLRHSYGCRTQL